MCGFLRGLDLLIRDEVEDKSSRDVEQEEHQNPDWFVLIIVFYCGNEHFEPKDKARNADSQHHQPQKNESTEQSAKYNFHSCFKLISKERPLLKWYAVKYYLPQVNFLLIVRNIKFS